VLALLKCVCIIKSRVYLPVLAAAARAAELVVPIHDLPGCEQGQCLLERGHNLGAALLVKALEDGQAEVHVLLIAQGLVVTPLALNLVLCHPAEDVLQWGPLDLHVTGNIAKDAMLMTCLQGYRHEQRNASCLWQ
jgi:alpha-beta hydrolase superfamily lysophospholipase